MLTTKIVRSVYHGELENEMHTVLRVDLPVAKAPYDSVIPHLLMDDTGVLGCTYERSERAIWVLVSSSSAQQVHDDIYFNLLNRLKSENVEDPSLSDVTFNRPKVTFNRPEDIPACTLAKLHLSMVASLDLPDGEISYNTGGRIYHRSAEMKLKDQETDEVWTDIFHLTDDMVLAYGISTFTRYEVLKKEADAISDPIERDHALKRLDDALGGAHVLTKNNQLRHVLMRDRIPKSELYIPLKTRKRREQKNTATFIRADIDGPYSDRARTLCSVLRSLNEAVDGFAHYDFIDYADMPFKVPKAVNPFRLLKGQRLCIESYADSEDMSHQLAGYASNVLKMAITDDPGAMTLAVVPKKAARDADDRYLTHEGSDRILLQHLVDDGHARDGLRKYEACRDRYLDRLDMWKSFHGEEDGSLELDDDGRFLGTRSGKNLRFPASKPAFSGRWLEADKAIVELLLKKDIKEGRMSAFQWKDLGLERPLHVAHYLKNVGDGEEPFYAYIEIDPDGAMRYWDDDDPNMPSRDRGIFHDIVYDTCSLPAEYRFLSGGPKAPGAYIATLDAETPIYVAKTDMRALPPMQFMEREIFWSGKKTAVEARRILGDTAGVHIAEIPDPQRSGRHLVLFSVGKSLVGRKDMNEPRATAIYAAISDEPIPCDLLVQLVCQKIVKTKDYSLPVIKKYMDEFSRYRDRTKRIKAIECRS